MKQILLALLLLPFLLPAQENPLDIFKPLEKDVWYAEGQWGDGSAFKQEINFEFSLDNKIVLVHSKGFTNEAQTEFGLRNQGIRRYDPDTKTIKFWEFDVFGGLTEGTVAADGKNLVYTYDYGGTLVTEMWVFKDSGTYEFIVGIYDDGEWKQKFLETEFQRKIQ